MNERFTGRDIRITNDDDDVDNSVDNFPESSESNPGTSFVTNNNLNNEVALTSVTFLFLAKHKIFGFIVLLLFIIIMSMSFI